NKDTHGQIEGQPLKKINPSITEKLRGATVRVENGAGMGTGYIAESDKDGSTIVTAAHVIYNPTITESEQGLRYLSVQDYKGNKSKVVSGCYMEENNGVFKSLSRGEFQPTDIAILRVSPPLGSATLKLAGSEPERGSWDPYFYNFQGRRKVNEPATYSGMVIANADSRNGYEVLTGITSFRNCEPKRLYNSMVSPCAAEGGSSGGPVVDRDTGNVIGISVASLITESKGYSAEDLLKTSGSVDPQFDVGLGTGSWPIISILVPTETIQTALESSTYRLIDYK
ncbi:MAG TPA: serine protease, partial [Candidatus Saccharimonadales bacterium]|nr:serine protease [Candidatus Saccharimonadales bacterium]